MVKIEHFGSSLYCPHCINQTFTKQGMIKKRAIMLGPIFDPALQSNNLTNIYMYINPQAKEITTFVR